MDMPGYKVLFEEGVFDTCASCHMLANAGSGKLGPNLEDVENKYENVDGLIDVLANGKGNGAMPVKVSHHY